MSELGPFHWYTSDLHFNHGNILKYTNRPFASVRKMNESLLENWNDRVRPTDNVAVLGDFAFGSMESLKDLVARLHGKLTLVRGNHDRKATSMARAGFANVVDSMLVSIRGVPALLSHYPPVHIPTLNYRERQPVLDQGMVCLHGHCHGKWRVNRVAIHVGVDAWDYRPVSAGEVATLVGSIRGLSEWPELEPKVPSIPPPSEAARQAAKMTA